MRSWTIRLAALAALFASLPQPAPASNLEDGIRELASQLAESMAQGEIRKIAVVEFSDLAGYASTLGPFIAEELTTQLLAVRPGAFDVVERQQLAKVLEEQKLSTTSVFDADNIESLGRILGIEAIITGSIADLGEEIKLNARAISVATARVFAAASAKCPKDATVETLLRQTAGPVAVGTAPSNRGAASRQVQASDVFFQNGFLRLTVTSLALSGDGREATLALQVENLTNEDLLLAVELDGQLCQARLIDDRGNQFDPAEAYAGGVVGMICLSMNLLSPPEGHEFTLISAKSRSTIVIRFRSQTSGGTRLLGSRNRSEGPSWSPGHVFAFAVNFLRLEGSRISRFAAGISNIQVAH